MMCAQRLKQVFSLWPKEMELGVESSKVSLLLLVAIVPH